MAEPTGPGLERKAWRLPDVIVYPTGGGTGVVGMAKAFDELEALGLVGPDRPRMICVQSGATNPIVRAFDQGELDITPLPPGKTIATGLNVAQNVGHKNVLRIIRQTGGCALSVSDDVIKTVIKAEWQERQFAWSPEGAATVAVLPELWDRKLIRQGDRVVLVNTAAAEKYLPTIRGLMESKIDCVQPPG
jgi:threonine synthase